MRPGACGPRPWRPGPLARPSHPCTARSPRMAEVVTGSPPWVRIRDAARHVGAAVEIRGWLTHRRSSGKVQFLVLRDGSGTLQCVAGVRDLPPEQWEAAAALTQESALRVWGTIKADARQPGG